MGTQIITRMEPTACIRSPSTLKPNTSKGVIFSPCKTQVLLTYMYKQAFSNLDFGYGSAIAVILTIGVFVLSAIQLRMYRVEDGDA